MSVMPDIHMESPDTGKETDGMKVRGSLEMAETTQERYTIEDIFALPDGERAELIDGKMYRMESPGRMHQKLLGELFYRISSYIREHKGDCEVYPAPFAVFINRDRFNYVEPDITVVCNQEKLDDKGCQGAPDWVIEIVSPGSRKMDCSIKLFKYRTAGVREYWIVDPMKKTVVIHNFETDDYAEYTFADSVPVGIYDNFVIDFTQVDIS